MRERREVWEGVVIVTFGSSSVERAHNLSNGVWPLVAMWKPRSLIGGCEFLVGQRNFYQGDGETLISRGSCVRDTIACGEGVIRSTCFMLERC